MTMRKVSEVPLHYNAVDILERNLAERADKVALYSPERAMTFRQVSNEANRVGNALKKLGVRVGDFVGILSLDGAEWVTSFFGTLKIGAIAVGLNTLLTPQEYAERQIERVFPDRGRGLLGLHTVNRAGELTVVDAFTRRRRFA